MQIEEAKGKNKEYIFADHFDTLEELLADCKLWIADEDVSAYCRWFDFKCMEALVNKIEKQQAELEKKDKVIDEMVEYIVPLDVDEDICKNREDCEDERTLCSECIKEYFYKKVE